MDLCPGSFCLHDTRRPRAAAGQVRPALIAPEDRQVTPRVQLAAERRGNLAEWPIAWIRKGAKNAGETRGRGSLSRWPVRGDVSAGRGSCGHDPALPCSPPRSHFGYS